MALELHEVRPSQWAAFASIASKIGRPWETLRKWVPPSGARRGPPAGPDDRGAAAFEGSRSGSSGPLQRERDPEEGIRAFRAGGARRPTEAMVTFIDENRDE